MLFLVLPERADHSFFFTHGEFEFLIKLREPWMVLLQKRSPLSLSNVYQLLQNGLHFLGEFIVLFAFHAKMLARKLANEMLEAPYSMKRKTVVRQTSSPSRN